MIFRIARLLLRLDPALVCMLPTTEYKPGISPFVTVFDRMGLDLDGRR